MRKITKTLALASAWLAGLLAASTLLRADQEPEPERITLMETLSEWQYPEATMPDGARMSDGGNPEVQDLKCQAVLATPAPFDDVVRFFEAKAAGLDPAKVVPARAVEIQDDSKARPVRVRVISVHKADRTDTLVITRADGEERTHIAWTQYRRLPAPKGR